MSTFHSTALRATLGIVALAGVCAAEAVVIPAPEPARRATLLRVQADVGPAGAAAAARAATGGKVLGVTAGSAGGRTVYRVKVLLPGGRMRTVTVDGPSGQVQG